MPYDLQRVRTTLLTMGKLFRIKLKKKNQNKKCLYYLYLFSLTNGMINAIVVNSATWKCCELADEENPAKE